MAKKSIGASLALYPTPVVVVGAMVDGKPSWTLVAHTGTVAHSHVMVSLVKAHYINKGIRETKKLSLNVVDASWLKEADQTGTTTGLKTDKSEAFAYTVSDDGVPMIDEAKISITCDVDGNYECEGFDQFMCKVTEVFADEDILNEKEKINYHVFKPALFEFPTYEYFTLGDKIGD
jgi:flavin reductase (DIM6/NTAB) family NADH-FMN oxidoreductase RutF